ncbi:MAG: Ldh family oxidoreductase [Chloroflexi bacterium]|nr:Ldh family oxidoreductase [Chloroflexota bacterium]
MPPDEYVRVPEADLRRFDLALLQNLGLSADHAGILADNLIAADMRGVRTHGHVMLPKYCKEIRRGSTKMTAQPRIVSETPATGARGR